MIDTLIDIGRLTRFQASSVRRDHYYDPAGIAADYPYFRLRYTHNDRHWGFVYREFNWSIRNNEWQMLEGEQRYSGAGPPYFTDWGDTLAMASEWWSRAIPWEDEFIGGFGDPGTVRARIDEWKELYDEFGPADGLVKQGCHELHWRLRNVFFRPAIQIMALPFYLARVILDCLIGFPASSHDLELDWLYVRSYFQSKQPIHRTAEGIDEVVYGPWEFRVWPHLHFEPFTTGQSFEAKDKIDYFASRTMDLFRSATGLAAKAGGWRYYPWQETG